MLVILQHEINRLKTAPYAWIILALGQFVLAWSFLARLETWLNKQHELSSNNSQFGVTDFVLIPQFQLALIFISFSLPFFTAQSVAGEKQHKTWPLLASSPVSLSHIIMGKFIALLSYCICFLILIILMCLCLSVYITIDYGQVFASTLIYLMTCTALIMIGLLISSFFSNIISATVLTLIVFLFLFNTDWLLIDGNNLFLDWLSFRQHQINAQKGLVSSEDILFFISLSVIFYIFTFIKLDKQRL